MLKKSSYFFILLSPAMVGCKKHNSSDISVLPRIASFAPSSGFAGTTVVITGTIFSSTASFDTVLFKGTAILSSAATSKSLTVIVPTGATIGPLMAIVGYHTAASSSFLQLQQFQNQLGAPIWQHDNQFRQSLLFHVSNNSAVLVTSSGNLTLSNSRIWSITSKTLLFGQAPVL
jgi:hypothetical protein